MNGNNTVPGAAPAGAAPAAGYYSRPELWTDAQKYTDETNATYERLKHLEGGLQTRSKEIEGMGNALQYLQYRLEIAAKTGDDALIENARQRYDQMYEKYKIARMDYARNYGEYSRAYSGYQTAWNAQNTYMTGQKSAEQQWRSTIRDPETVQAELAAIEGQIAAQRETDRAKRQAEYEAAQKAKPWYEKLAGYIGEISDTTLPTYSAQGASAGPASPELKALVEKQKMLQEEYEWAMYLPYADLMQNEDFAEKSQYKSTYRGGEQFNNLSGTYTDTGFDDIAYDYINRDETARNRQSVADLQSNAALLGLDNSERGEMTKDEIAIFNYIYATQGKEAAYEYITYLTSDLNARQRAAQERQWAEYAKERPGAASAFSVMMSPMKGLSYLGQAADYFADGKMEQNAGYNKFSYIPGSIREQVTEDIKASAKTEFWGGVGSFGYQTAMSMADFLTTTLVSGGNSTLAMAIMGSGAAADTVLEGKDRGLSDGQAFALGTIAGVAEALAEKKSLSSLLDLSKLEKSAWGYVVKNMADEGLEEVTTSLVNTVADILISQDKSQWQLAIDAYMADGKTEGQAFGLALADQALALGLDALGGALSGGVMAGGNVAISKGTTALTNRQNQKQQTVPQGAAEVPPAAAPATFQEEVQRQVAENLDGKKAAQGATAQLAGQEYTQNDGGMINGAEDAAGADILSGSGQRNDGAGAGEQAGGLAGRAGQTAPRGRLTADQLRTQTERSRLGADLRIEKVSAQSLGIAAGTQEATLRVVPQDVWDEGMATKARQIYEETGYNVTYVQGAIRINRNDGKIRLAGGVCTEGGQIIVQCDSVRFTAEQLADHEAYHAMIRAYGAEGGRINDLALKAILENFTQEEFDRVMDDYIQGLRGVIDVESAQTGEEYAARMQQVLEEVLADAYAGMNRFGGGAVQFSEPVRQALVDNGISRPQNQENGVRQTNGPNAEQYAVTDQESIKQQISLAESRLAKMNPVANISVSASFFNMDKTAKQNWAIEKLRSTGYTVNRRGLGVIEFAKKRIKSAFNYFLKNSAEEAVFEALPAVLRDGIIIETRPEHKGRAYGTITIAAPVVVNGERGNMAVVVKQTTGNLYKVHRILSPGGSQFVLNINETEPTSGGGVTNSGSLAAPISPVSNEIVSDESTVVKENFAVEDDGEYAALEGEYSAEQAQWREMWFRDRLGEEGYAKYQEAQRKQEQTRKEESRQHQRAQSQQRREDIRQRQEQQLQALKERAEKERSEVRPVKAKKALRRVLFDIFSIPAGQKTELGKLIDGYADRLIQNGRLTEADYRSFFDRMYESGVMEVPADEFYQMGRDYLKHGKIYVDAQTLADLGDDWADLRRRAFAAGIYLTRDSADMGIDQWHHALDADIPGLMPKDATDMRSVLERIIQIAEEGKGEKMSLAEYTRVLAGQESISEDAFLDNMERQLDWALRAFAVSAGIEMEVRQQQKDTAAGSRRESARLRAQLEQERENRKEMARLAQERKQLRQLQEKTLKQLQWLSKNRDKAPEDLRAAMDAVLSDLDIYAIGAANASGWSKKYNATWKDIVDIYLDAKENDPNFLPSKELETMVHRLQDRKIEDLDIGALNDLYKAAVGLRTEFYNRNNVLGDEMNRLMAEVYADSVDEINAAPGKFSANKLKKLFNEAQLTAMNVLERMGGWNPKGAFYSMAKQLERGERDYRAYIVKANRMLQAFLENNEDWVKKADGQGKDGIWYEVKFHPLTKLGYGDKPIFGAEEVTVYMTPMQKIHLYLESKNVDNLRHMVGGRTFVDKALYRDGKRQEALAQGVTVKMAPETVKKLVSDLTEQERELAGLLEQYYNQFATGEINRISNILYGYDKAMGKNYAPIYTNKNYTSTSFELDEIMAEHAGNLKARIHSKNPSYNISALDAFERHAEKTARFVGMAIPTRNWDMLINWHSNSSSMSDIITHKWGDDGLKYVTDLIQSLQTGASVRTDSISEGLAKLQSNYISSVFGFNVSIVAKQLGSIPMAGAYLDMKNIPSPAQVKNIDRTLIAKYTQDLDWRTMGYSMPETKFLKDNPNKLQSSKVLGFLFGGDAITAMDGWAASTLWPWAENKVRREHPDLDVGTQAEIDSGASPFYKKVAEEFENAVSRSQSVSDEMHQGSLRKSKNPLAKAFTMFRSDSAQSYNALRQMIGEAQYHIRSGSDPQAVKAAKRSVGAVAGAMLLNAFWGEAVSLLVALVKNGAKYYRDDEEELTAGSVIGEAAGNMLASMAGTVTGGEELYDLLASIFFGESRYATEVPGMEQFNDLLDTVAGSAKGFIDVVAQAVSVAQSGGNGWQHLQENSGAMLGAVKDVAEAIAAYGFGIPVGNAEAYLLGALKWISPEFAAAYEDAFQKLNKGDLPGSEGDVLADRVGRVFRGRGMDVSEDVAAVIAELYEAGYRTAMPSDVPASVSIDGENREMNAYQQQCYGNIWTGIVGNVLEDLVKSARFAQAGAKAQAKMISYLYSYAGEIAKGNLFDDYEPSTRDETVEAFADAGMDMTDFLYCYANYNEIYNSDLSAAEKATKFAHWLDGEDFSEAEQSVIRDELVFYNMSPASANRYEGLVSAGLEKDDALELTAALAELVPEEGNPNVTDVQRWRTCVDFATHEGVQLSALSSVMKPEQYLKVSTAYSLGVSPDAYVKYYEIRVKFDADKNGAYTQAEVKKAIDSMGQGMTTKQKAVLWQVVSGASSAKNNPYSVEAGQKLLDMLKKKTGSKTG